MSKIKSAIVLADLHAPYHDKKALAAVEQFMGDHTFDYYINLGDLLDFDCISNHNKDKLREVEGKRVESDYVVVNQMLDRHQSLIRKNNKNAEFILLEGNHEARMERYIDANPVLEGLFEVEKKLNLKDRGFQWYRYNDTRLFQIGKLAFHHGIYTSKYHSYKHLENFGKSIVYGHLHTFQIHNNSTFGEDDARAAHAVGCLCEPEQSYIQGRPRSWRQGFAVIYFHPNGNFNYYPITMFNHSFIYDGKEYKGN